MKMQAYLRSVTLLSAAGVLFSGYLSGVRFFSNSCAFNEPCPMFLGYPACYFGFGMFVSMFAISAFALMKTERSRWPIVANITVAALGSLFAGYFALAELRRGFSEGFVVYGLGISTCIYGAVFFITILVISLFAQRGLERAQSHGT